MPPRGASKKKDPTGTAVFYPSSLPPPPRRSPRENADSPGSPSPAQSSRSSPATPPRHSSLLPPSAVPATATPYDDVIEFDFPPQSPPEYSLPNQLTSMLESWNIFTPSPGSSRYHLPELNALDSVGDLSLLSLEPLPLSHLIEEAYIQDEASSPAHPAATSPAPLKPSSLRFTALPCEQVFSPTPPLLAPIPFEVQAIRFSALHKLYQRVRYPDLSLPSSVLVGYYSWSSSRERAECHSTDQRELFHLSTTFTVSLSFFLRSHAFSWIRTVIERQISFVRTSRPLLPYLPPWPHLPYLSNLARNTPSRPQVGKTRSTFQFSDVFSAPAPPAPHLTFHRTSTKTPTYPFTTRRD